MKTNNKGFTIMELLIVIAIIALLAAIILGSLGAAKQRGSDTGKMRSVSEIRNALNVYFNDSGTGGGNGSYPAGTVATGVANLTAALVPKYISSIDPNIKYFSATGSTYHLGMVLESVNVVLNSDSDTSVGFPGLSSDCVNPGLLDSCYDIIQ